MAFTWVLRFISILGAAWSRDATSAEGIISKIGYLLFPVEVAASFEFAHLNHRKKRVFC